MKKLENLIILALVCGGAFLLYQKLDSMGPEYESPSSSVQAEAATTETKPAAPATPAQPAPATPAPTPAETPAATTAATPAAPAPSPAPTAQPATQPAAPATPMAEQPVTPAVAPATPATPVAAQPAPAAPAQPTPTVAAPSTPAATPVAATPAVTTPATPAPAATTPAPTAAMPAPQPAAQPPAQVATATPAPAPAAQPAPQPQKKLAEMTLDDWLAKLPANGGATYRTARASAESKGDMIGMRSWFGQWRRYLADPMRAVLELDMAGLLIQSKASYPNESAAKAAKRGNANEAKMLISGIVSRRINNVELSAMVDKVRQDVDRELEQTK